MTLKSVAKTLSVSTATISNAFSRPDQLSKSLREKILKECSTLGYHGPNITARSLRKGKSGVLGVLLSDPLSYYFNDPVANQFLSGIAETVEQHQKQLLMLSGADSGKTNTGIESLPDSFIVYGSQEHNPLYNRIIQTGKPIVTVDFDAPEFGSINVDNQAAAYEVASYALKKRSAPHAAILGLRLIHSERVCRITDDELYDESESVARRRLNGYKQAAEESNIALSSELIWHIPHNTFALAKRAAKELLSVTPRPNIILCMSDVIASAVLNVAAEMGVSVPAEIGVVGFDDIPEASRTSPPLTTICQKSKEKGKQAVLMLVKGDTSSKILMPTELIVRDSA
ncbi:LacI family DNA-binding transcriptional regulator [Paraglaciecola aquimarina]|uniref:LacI family DNA-binding transcriptional regulator n=1 Tax=Paraglaciecola aquimarina TaxID=1235557 RepID=A0ABU3SV76_9ALTE|nr:LacI family DNA-binding transcriptional regulator [Paraglaciecola aquimarina]MDU0353904.1 LacI family DNA-binding transcriptional regulator [Paraglaciecola aquimarina]